MKPSVAQKLMHCSNMPKNTGQMEAHSLHPSPAFPFLPYIRWSCWSSQVGDGGLQDKHIALGSELETTQALGSAPRLMGNDFCSALSLAKQIPSNMSLVLL